MAGHPLRNPFPARGTSSAEETSRRDFRDDWARHTPTALLPGVRCAVRLAGDYLRAFRGDARDGGLGCLYGAHGVGKTHAARHMMAEAGREAPDAVQLYLRLQEDDFVAAYRRLVSQLPQTLLADLNLRYLDRLWEDLVDRAGDPDLVPSGQVLEEQAKGIAAVAGNGAEFQRALSFLANPGLSEAAYDWLCGRPVSAEAALALGVRGQLDDPVMCRYGVQLLTALITGSGRPFMMVLDQCEKFLLEDGVPVPANTGLLQSLAEVVPRAGGMLLLVASEAGWESMPPDFHQRIGAGAVRLLPLTPDEAGLVLSAYISPAAPRPDIRPFTDSGLLALLRHSGGNIRLMLQLSWASFEAAAGAAVDDKRVDAAAARHGSSPGLAELAMLVESTLLAAGLAAERSGTDGGAAEFRFPGRSAPRAVIRLSEAIFYDDEAARATELIRLGRDSAAGGSPPFTALVVTGYVSPAVLDHLRQAVHRVLVADGSATFSRGLDGVLAEIGSVLAGTERSVRDPRELDETLRALAASLEELNSVRREEAVTLRRSLSDVADRLERGEEKPASGWPARRAELTARITEARARRAASDWEEFRKVRAEVVRRRAARIRWLAGTALVSVALGAVTLATASQNPGFLAAGLSAALVAAGLAAYHGGRLVTSPVHCAAAPLESRRALVLLARELRPHADARSADPVCRYAYALAEDPDENYRPLATAMLAEPLALVRQAIGHRMAVTERSPADCVPEVQRGLRERTPEVLLLLARGQRHTEVDRPPRVLRDLPPELRVLVALANPGAPDLADGAVSRHPAELVLSALGVRGAGHPLARARGGPPGAVPIETPRNELRAAAHLLSPLERDGLGAYDWLPLVAEIDGLYLFFEELLYHQEEMASNRHKS